MSINMYLILFLILISVIGLYSIVKKIYSLAKCYNFSGEFFDKLEIYIESNGRDNVSYSWLVSKSSKMQNYIGLFGIMQYRPAYQNYIINNYQLIINGLSELRQYYESPYSYKLANQMAQTLQEALIRYIGTLEDSKEIYFAQLKNPIIWFREGIQIMIGLPFQVLVWFGIVSSVSMSKFTTNIIFKFLSGIIALLAFLGTVITIVLGWKEFKTIMLSFI